MALLLETPFMIEELKNEEIINKVGGRFKLVALIQRRMQELLQGGRPLIEDTEGLSMLEIVVQEILQDKITFDITGGPADLESTPGSLL
jgi:DNA-directed RNA polymerase subunit omega